MPRASAEAVQNGIGIAVTAEVATSTGGSPGKTSLHFENEKGLLQRATDNWSLINRQAALVAALSFDRAMNMADNAISFRSKTAQDAVAPAFEPAWLSVTNSAPMTCLTFSEGD